MELKKKIEALILEASQLKFTDNCETSQLGIFGKFSPRLREWFKNCENIIYENGDVYSKAWIDFEALNIEQIEGSFEDEFIEIKKGVVDILRDLVIHSEDEPLIIKDEKIIKSINNIFIVHGQNESIKNNVARFVEKLHLNPIILHEQASSGKTIIEKIESYSNVEFGIILYSSSDEGRKANSNEELKKRARQNVIFEHGYLIGKIGRNKVCALIENGVEIPNDLSGVVYVEIDNKNAWKYELAKEMKSAGLDINMNLFV